MKDKYLWFTDVHLDTILPWTLIKFIRHVRHEKPKGIFLTGDISNGFMLGWHLKMLAMSAKCPIYFVLGNHDYHFSSLEKVHAKVRKLCKKYPNLVWMTDNEVVPLNKEVAVIGTEGWYDAEKGKPEYLKFTFDWFMVKNFRGLPNMNARINLWRQMSNDSAGNIVLKLEKAIEQGYKTIYIVTHFPPWREATRDIGTPWEKFWLPYNANAPMGQRIESVMKGYEDHNVIVLAGHTHDDCWIRVEHNIECKVSRAKHFGAARNEERIFI